MRKRERQSHDAALRVREFMHGLAPNEPRFVLLRKKVDASIVRLEATARAIPNKPDVGRDEKAIGVLKADLRYKHLLPISRHGKQLMKDEPGITTALRVPTIDARSDEFLAAAKRIADTVRPYKALFVEDGFVRGFLPQMASSAKALRVRSRQTDTARTELTAANAAYRAELRRFRGLVSVIEGHLLDPMYRSIAVVWKTAKRVRTRMGRPRKPRGRRPPPSDAA